MDELLNTRITMNGSKYRSSLERIIDKYSKVHYHDGTLEVDLDQTDSPTLHQYIRQCKAEITQLESKSLTDLNEESMRAQDTSTGSPLDVSYEDDETCVSSGRLPLEDIGCSTSDLTGQTMSSVDENLGSVSEMDVQPEDRDQELEMSLRSHGGSLVELYPGMISRIGEAWRRQHVFEAADTVLRRYRRWRRHSGRSSLGSTFIVPMRPNGRNAKHEAGRTLLEESRSSPRKGPCAGAETTQRPPLRTVNEAQQLSPHQPVLVMDFFEPRETSLNETFTVSRAFRLGEPPSFRLGEPPSLGPGEPPTFRLGEPPTFRLGEPPSFRLGEPPSFGLGGSVSPSRPCHPAANARTDPPSRSRRQVDVCSTYAAETSRDRSDFYGSPVRQSPAGAGTGLGRSPHGFSRSPRTHRRQSLPRDPRDVHSWLAGQLSFDSSLPSVRVSDSPKKLDEDFLKLYHKFVCQSRSSSFGGVACRFCARNSEAGGAPSSSSSSSALAALALSPHRSLLRKRHRELDRDAHPQSKRYRDEHCPSSPGSKRYGRELLRRRLLQPQYGAFHAHQEA